MSQETSTPARPNAAISEYAKKLGIVCERVEDDRAVYSMAFRTDNVTVADVVHGGAICSLADVAATGAAWSAVTEPARHRGVTIDLSLSFISAARSTALVADARVVKRGASVCFCDVEVTTPRGDLVARCKVVYKLSRVLSPRETMMGLFAGKSRRDAMTLLAELERAGADAYRSFAQSETDAELRRVLIDSAEREEANARALEGLE